MLGGFSGSHRIGTKEYKYASRVSFDIASPSLSSFSPLTAMRIPLLQAIGLHAILVAALPVEEATTTKSSGLAKCAAGLNGKLPSPTPSDFQFSGNVRTYYVAAEEVEWNYAPTGWDNWIGVSFQTSSHAKPARLK